MFAIKRFATFRTNSYFRITTAIHENNRLISTCNTIRKRFTQSWRHEHAFLLVHLSHINNRHFGERCCGRTILERQEFKVSRFGIAECFKARRCTAKHNKCAMLLRQVESQVSRMITRSRVLLFKRRIMFFVHNNNIKFKRRKNCTARSKNHFSRTIKNRHIACTFLRSRKRRMQHHHRHFQKIFEPRSRLWSKPNFGHENQHAFFSFECFTHQFLINSRFATAGHTMQKRSAKTFFVQIFNKTG